MYYSHFGLHQPPFKITPNTDFFFSGGNRGPILEALIYAITHGEGIIKVTGEVGSGKTMLCHMLQARLPAHVDTVYIANPSVSPEEILRAIAFELQIGVPREASRLELTQALHDFLLERHAAGRRVVVFVEESQSMPLETLEEIRLLSNLETRSDKLLQIVLFGQPELDRNLRDPRIRQLRDRITHAFHLEPLAEPEVHEYIMFRLRAAGYRGPDLFPPAAVRLIARASRGLTRRINVLADKTLLAAFAENTHTIRPRHVRAAMRDSELGAAEPPRISVRRIAAGAALAGAGAALGIGLYAFLRPAEPGPQAPPVPAAVAAGPARLAAPRSAEREPPAAPEERDGRGPVPQQPVAAESPPATPAAALASVPAGTSPAAAATASQPPPAAAGASDPLEARLAATREWLAGAPAQTYTIQLLGAEDAGQLRDHLKAIAKLIEVNKLFVYRTTAGQKPYLAVLYGSFADRRAAQEALDRLPAWLKTNRPFLRTVQGIRGELRRLEAAESGAR